jgi:hypothetical protein
LLGEIIHALPTVGAFSGENAISAFDTAKAPAAARRVISIFNSGNPLRQLRWSVPQELVQRSFLSLRARGRRNHGVDEPEKASAEPNFRRNQWWVPQLSPCDFEKREIAMSNQNQNPGQQNQNPGQKPGQQQGGGQKPGQQQQDPNRQGQKPGQQGQQDKDR